MARSDTHSPAPLLPGTLLLLTLLSQGLAQEICSIPPPSVAEIPEDTAVGFIITGVTAQDGVTIALVNDFGGTLQMQGNNIVLSKQFDYETQNNYVVKIRCQKGAESIEPNSLIIIVTNVNDNDPVFDQSIYQLNVNELLPVGTSVGRVLATDADSLGPLFYEILPDPPQDYFELQGVNLPNIVLKNRFDYDTVKSVQFIVKVRDTDLSTTETRTATASVSITVQDVDNRPPWFQPCTEETINFTKICLSPGYTGQVTLTQQATGPLPLKPNNLSAKDGDNGINAPISFRINSGNEDGIFAINSDTGEITMTRVANVPGPIVLRVMAFQRQNPDQFATTTVTFEVKTASRNPPKFEKDTYKGYISLDTGVGSLIMEGPHSTKPLRVQATDQDYVDGINPNVTYEVQDSSAFIITGQGFILLAQTIPAGSVSFQVRAFDKASGEEALAAVQVEVSPETPSTTPRPSTTTDMPTTPKDMASTPKDMATTPKDMASVSTAVPSTSADMTSSSTPQTATDPPVLASGLYGVEDMAALGASLGVLLLICLILLILMAVYINKHKGDRRKVKEASHFHSNLTGASLKGGVQYTNEGFQTDGDTVSSDVSWSDKPEDRKASVVEAAVSRAVAPVAPVYETALPDTSSLAGSSGEAEKEVKPILTKERKDEDGYKAVWFKQDIDPDAKDEVTIIPDRAEQADDGDEEDEEDDGSEGAEADSNHDRENSDTDDYPEMSDV